MLRLPCGIWGLGSVPDIIIISIIIITILHIIIIIIIIMWKFNLFRDTLELKAPFLLTGLIVHLQGPKLHHDLSVLVLVLSLALLGALSDSRSPESLLLTAPHRPTTVSARVPLIARALGAYSRWTYTGLSSYIHTYIHAYSQPPCPHTYATLTACFLTLLLDPTSHVEIDLHTVHKL